METDYGGNGRNYSLAVEHMLRRFNSGILRDLKGSILTVKGSQVVKLRNFSA